MDEQNRKQLTLDHLEEVIETVSQLEFDILSLMDYVSDSYLGESHRSVIVLHQMLKIVEYNLKSESI